MRRIVKMSRTYKELANEVELLEILGIKKQTLGRLRNQGLPFVALCKKHRVYIAADVIEWLLQNKLRRNRFQAGR